MFEKITNFFKKIFRNENDLENNNSKNAAKERLHLVLMQDRANVSADFLELMKQEIIDVIKKYIVIDDKAIDVRLTNQANDDGTNGAPALYANIPILNIRNDVKAEKIKEEKDNEEEEKRETKELIKEEKTKENKKTKEVETVEDKTEDINKVDNVGKKEEELETSEIVKDDTEEK